MEQMAIRRLSDQLSITTSPFPLTAASLPNPPSPIPTDSDAMLTRVQAARALTAAGYPCSPATLASKASRGDGPLFRRFGTKPLYRWADLLGWVNSKLSRAVHATSELDVATPSSNRAGAIGDGDAAAQGKTPLQAPGADTGERAVTVEVDGGDDGNASSRSTLAGR
jgi:hypothetical protein